MVTSRGRVRAGGVQEAARQRIARRAQIRRVLEEHAIEDALARRQVGQHDARGEIGGLERRWTDHARAIAKAFGRGVLDERAAPDDRVRLQTTRASAVDVARRAIAGFDDRADAAALLRRSRSPARVPIVRQLSSWRE